jgi:hypothetical protein
VELYLHSPNKPSWSGAKFKKKHRDKFTLPYLKIEIKLYLDLRER